MSASRPLTLQDLASDEDKDNLESKKFEGGGGSSNSKNYIKLSSANNREKERLIGHILQLQGTFDDIQKRIEKVESDNRDLKEENEKLQSFVEEILARRRKKLEENKTRKSNDGINSSSVDNNNSSGSTKANDGRLSSSSSLLS